MKGFITMLKKILNILLLIFFTVTILAPLTGVQIHKISSTLFLLLTVTHTIVYRKKLGMKKYLMLGVVIAAFFSGLFGMIWDQYTIVLILHRLISIASVFFLAIHIFLYHKGILVKAKEKNRLEKENNEN